MLGLSGCRAESDPPKRVTALSAVSKEVRSMGPESGLSGFAGGDLGTLEGTCRVYSRCIGIRELTSSY